MEASRIFGAVIRHFSERSFACLPEFVKSFCLLILKAFVKLEVLFEFFLLLFSI